MCVYGMSMCVRGSRRLVLMSLIVGKKNMFTSDLVMLCDFI